MLQEKKHKKMYIWQQIGRPRVCIVKNKINHMVMHFIFIFYIFRKIYIFFVFLKQNTKEHTALTDHLIIIIFCYMAPPLYIVVLHM